MNDLEFFPTPAWQTRALLKHCPVYGTLLEPCCGAGDIADVLEQVEPRPVVLRNDLQPRVKFPLFTGEPGTLMTRADATDPKWWKSLPGVDFVVTNPPFTQAPRILPLAFQHARVGVAFLLRLSYLEPAKDRGSWLAANPPAKMIFLSRASYDGAGNDLVATFWGVWFRRASPYSEVYFETRP